MKLKDKVQFALDESRMLIMGVQVLLGFNLESFLTKQLDRLPHPALRLKLASTAFLLVAMWLLMLPVARHRLVEDGKDSNALHRFTRRATELALFPFALALGCDCFLVACRVAGSAVGTAVALTVTAAALAAWYALPAAAHARHRKTSETTMETASLNDKIRHVLTEVRVVLPGTQALLGFQFVAVLQDGFDRLPRVSRDFHLVGLGFLGASVILLMMPAAYHRIAEDGEISERLHRFSSRTLLASMIALAFGLACDTVVIVGRGADSLTVGFVAAGVWLLASFGAAVALIAQGARARRSEHEDAFRRHGCEGAVSSGAE